MLNRRRTRRRDAIRSRRVQKKKPTIKKIIGQPRRATSVQSPRARLALSPMVFPLTAEKNISFSFKKPKASTNPATQASDSANHAFSFSKRAVGDLLVLFFKDKKVIQGLSGSSLAKSNLHGPLGQSATFKRRERSFKTNWGWHTIG